MGYGWRSYKALVVSIYLVKPKVKMRNQNKDIKGVWHSVPVANANINHPAPAQMAINLTVKNYLPQFLITDKNCSECHMSKNNKKRREISVNNTRPRTYMLELSKGIAKPLLWTCLGNRRENGDNMLEEWAI